MEIKGDFLGFSYGDKRSEDLGIVRVSDGDRYDEDLQPEINDIVAEVPGMDGAYYFGSTFGKRTIPISFAFDSMTEKQFRQFRKVFGRRHQNELIFDERPYKKYIAKVESPIELSYVCFDESKKEKVEILGIGNVTHEVMRPTEEMERIYKGDGKIDFICYFPFAKSVYKQLPFSFKETTDTEIQQGKNYYIWSGTNSEEKENNEFHLVTTPVENQLELYYEKVLAEGVSDWAVSSGILTDEEYESVDTYENGSITVYNPGDVATGFRLYVPMSAASQDFTLSYTYSEAQSGDVQPQLVIGAVEAKKNSNFTLVSEPSGNPQEQGWYQLNGSKYELTTDIEVASNKDYYIQDSDAGILIDTNNGLIVGVKSEPTYDQNGNAIYETTGNLYNEFVKSGYFFKLEPDEREKRSTLTVGNLEGCQIFYDYLYF